MKEETGPQTVSPVPCQELTLQEDAEWARSWGCESAAGESKAVTVSTRAVSLADENTRAPTETVKTTPQKGEAARGGVYPDACEAVC